MQINLTTKLTEYKSKTAEDTKDLGFAQKGYQSILTYDSWRKQKCLMSDTVTHAEDINSVQLSAGISIEITELKEFLDFATSKDATRIYISGSTDDDNCVTSITIESYKSVNKKRDESSFYQGYEYYVNDVNQSNIKTWNSYKHELEEAEKAEFDELQKFMNAKKVYESLKSKFE